MIARSRLVTKSFIHSSDRLIDAIIYQIKELLRDSGVLKKDVLGVGIGLPGLVNPKEGIVNVLPNVAGWNNVPLKKIIQQRLKLRVAIDNDVNMITLAEWRFGAGKGCKNFLCMTLGTGVGGGLILNDRIYRGEGFVAGEIGHFPYLGKSFEKHIGNKVLVKKARQQLRRKIDEMSQVYFLAKDGNQKALRFWESIAQELAPTITGVVNLLNPRLIIIGGGVANNFPFFAPKLKEIVRESAMSVQSHMLKIVRAKLGDDAGVIGARILLEEGVI